MSKRLPDDVLNFFKEQGARGGKIGGKLAAAKLTAAQRRARALKASRAAAVARAKKANARRKRKNG